MRVPGPAGGASIAAAMGRLARLGRFSTVLSGSGPLDGLTGRPLAALVGDCADALGAVLEDVLGAVESPEAAVPAAGGAVPRSVRAGGPTSAATPRAVTGTPRAVAGPERPGARIPPRFEARRPQAGGKSSRPPAARITATAGAPAAPRSDPPEGSSSLTPTPLDLLSPPARLGASTPVRLPATRVGPDLAAGSASAREATGLPGTPARASSGRAPEPGAEAAVVGPLAGPRESTPRESTPRERPRGGRSIAREAGRAALEQRAPRAAATGAPHLGSLSPLAPVVGLAGLVSWWDSLDAGRQPEGSEGGVPAPPGRAVSWSSVGERADEPPPASGEAFEGSPLVRLSLRSVLEELLVSEARASGIEVCP